MPFVPTTGTNPYLFTPQDCTFNIALNADLVQIGQAWTTWSPAPFWIIAGPTATLTTGYAIYNQVGKTVAWALNITVGSVGSTGTFIGFTPPVTPIVTTGSGGRDITSGKGIAAQIGTSSNSAVNPADGTAFINSSNVIASGVYQSA